jgi:hypothetical protein
VLEREHADAPRFALVATDGGEAAWLAAADLEPRTLPLDEYAALVAATDGGRAQAGGHVPPLTLLAPAAVLGWLRESALLPGALLALQSALRAVGIVTLHAPGGEAPLALLARTRDLHRLEPGSARPLTLRTAGAAPAARLDTDAFTAAVATAREPAAPAHGRTLGLFCEHLHMAEWRTLFPHRGALDAQAAWFVCGPAAADRAAVLALAAAWRARDGAASLHLAAIGPDGLDATPAALAPFDTITPLGVEEVAALLPPMLAGAGVAVHAGAPRSMLVLRRHGPGDTLRVALTSGPGDAARDDPLLDAYLAVDEAAARRLEDLGAIRDKITVMNGWDDPAAATAIATAHERRRPR